MLAGVALVVAIVAIIIAKEASRRVQHLEHELRTLKSGGQAILPVPPSPTVETPQPQPQPAPLPPPPPPATQPAAARTRAAFAIDWENLVGIKLFSWIGGILFVLAAVFLFKHSVERGWLRPPIRAALGLGFGISVLILCELRVARNYRFFANAMHGAGIAILYATLFSMNARWQLIPTWTAFLGMLLVTGAAVYLSTRRESVFIALLGLLGGFATPALPSTGENRPIALFSYLLMLNGGISWIAYRKRWPLLTLLSVALTTIYQWKWVDDFMTTGQLPLAAGIFFLFALIGAAALWDRNETHAPFRRIAAAAAVLPLLFAFFTAIVPEYGAQYSVLFGFLLLVAVGLAAIARLRGPEWLNTIGGIATLMTFFIWLFSSYQPASWPWILVFLALFLALYLATRAYAAAGLLFFVFIGLAAHEEQRWQTIAGAMLALLAIVMILAIRLRRPTIAAPALGLSSVALMLLDPPLAPMLAAHAAIFAAALIVAWMTEAHVLAPVATLFYAVAVLADGQKDDEIVFAAVPYALFIAYALLAAKKPELAPQLAGALASAIFFFHAWFQLDDFEAIGLLPIALAIPLLAILWRLLPADLKDARVALVAGAALAFLSAAIPMQLEEEAITIAWALEAAALMWLFRHIPHRGLLAWSVGLASAVFARLVLNPEVFDYYARSGTPVFNWYLYAYLMCAAAMFAAAWLARAGVLRNLFASAGVIELFVLLNIEIADYYSKGDTLTFNFMSSSLAQDLTYTICWAFFAIIMLVAGIAMHARGARVAALGLLFVTIVKCFLHDLARLGGLYRVASLFGLAVSLVLVGLLLQKFVMLARSSESAPAPHGTT